MKPCSHRQGNVCHHPQMKLLSKCVMLDQRVADCRWWKSERYSSRVVTAPWSPSASGPAPLKGPTFVGPPKPTEELRKPKRRKNRKLKASPFDALMKGITDERTS